MTTVKYGARSINLGEAEIVMTGGATSFSTVPFLLRNMRWEGKKHSSFMVEDPIIPLGYKDYAPVAVDSGNVAIEYGVSREEQDEFAYQSHMKYGKAWERGFFKHEMVPLTIEKKDKKGNVISSKVLDKDEQYRPDITLEGLAKLKPIFGNPTCTAGNAPGMNDGATAQIIMKRETADKLGYEPLYTVVATSAIALQPRIMPVSPAFAIKKCLDDANLSIDDMKFIERSWPPFAPGTEESTYFIGLNRGKRSIELNFKEQKAKDIFYRLVSEADIVFENFAPGVADKLGVGYEDCKKIKSDIIYLSISAFGQYGPLSRLPGYDMLAQAMGGLISITGYPEMPLRVGSSIGDIIAGLYGGIGLLGAIYYRDKTGEGQHIDVSLVDCIFTCLENSVPAYTITGRPTKRQGSRHPDGGPYDVYTCKDGFVCVVASNEKLWGNMCQLMGVPEMATDPKFNSNVARMENIEEMTAFINNWMKDYTVDEMVTMLREARVAVAPILEVPQICESENTKARNMLVEYEHATAGKIKVPGNPIKFGAYEALAELPPPFKGQHTKEVLSEMGFSEEEISEMLEKGEIGDGFITRAKNKNQQ
jgi:crotonobetainyl-CoA:carnitine CoA-transferase CaiB-like acyl-CoA transferase